jgi:threonyl-tRNA synthetase
VVPFSTIKTRLGGPPIRTSKTVGDREVEAEQVNLRMRDESVPGAMSIDAFVEMVQTAVEEKRLL